MYQKKTRRAYNLTYLETLIGCWMGWGRKRWLERERGGEELKQNLVPQFLKMHRVICLKTTTQKDMISKTIHKYVLLNVYVSLV